MQHEIDLDPAATVSSRRRVVFCSMPFDIVDSTEVYHSVTARPAESPFAYVATPNVDHVVRLQNDEATLLPLYRDAWISVCDSRVLAALSTTARSSLPVTTGSDLTQALLRTAIAPSDRINVIGADLDVVGRLQARYQLNDVTHLAPSMRLNDQPDEIDKCVEFIERHPARFTFLAVGSPQQEKIAHGCWARGQAKGIGLCIGAALHFAAGLIRRAPAWVQGLGLEWLYRLTREPGRLARRYLVDDMRIFPIFSRHLLTAPGAPLAPPYADARDEGARAEQGEWPPRGRE